MRLVLRNTTTQGKRLTDVIHAIRRANGRIVDTTENMVLLEASPSAAEEIAQRVEGWQVAQETVIPRPGCPFTPT